MRIYLKRLRGHKKDALLERERTWLTITSKSAGDKMKADLGDLPKVTA
jgi:hypothetical protein